MEDDGDNFFFFAALLLTGDKVRLRAIMFPEEALPNGSMSVLRSRDRRALHSDCHCVRVAQLLFSTPSKKPVEPHPRELRRTGHTPRVLPTRE